MRDASALRRFEFKGIIIEHMSESKEGFWEIQREFREHWAQVDPFLFELFSRKFPSESKAAFYFASTSRPTTLLLSNTILRKTRERVTNFHAQEQVDLCIPLEDSHLWLKFSSEQVKVHYHSRAGVANWQPYFSFSSTRKFKNSSFKAGAVLPFDGGEVDVKTRFNVGQHRAENFYYWKGRWGKGRVRLGGLIAAHRKQRQVNLQKNDLLAAVEVVKGSWVGVLLGNDGFRNYKINYGRLGNYFDSLKAAYMLDLPALRMGLLYEYSIEDSLSKKIEAAVEYRSQEGLVRTAKLRLNTLWEMGVAVEGERGSWRVEGGAAWSNVSKSAWPSHYSLGLAYY